MAKPFQLNYQKRKILIVYGDRKSESVSFSDTMFVCLNNSRSVLSVWMFEFLRSWNIIVIILIIIIISYCGDLLPSSGEQRHFSSAGINLLSFYYHCFLKTDQLSKVANEIKFCFFLLL